MESKRKKKLFLSRQSMDYYYDDMFFNRWISLTI